MGVQLLSILEAATWLGYLLGINESGANPPVFYTSPSPTPACLPLYTE